MYFSFYYPSKVFVIFRPVKLSYPLDESNIPSLDPPRDHTHRKFVQTLSRLFLPYFFLSFLFFFFFFCKINITNKAKFVAFSNMEALFLGGSFSMKTDIRDPTSTEKKVNEFVRQIESSSKFPSVSRGIELPLRLSRHPPSRPYQKRRFFHIRGSRLNIRNITLYSSASFAPLASVIVLYLNTRQVHYHPVREELDQRVLRCVSYRCNADFELKLIEEHRRLIVAATWRENS